MIISMNPYDNWKIEVSEFSHLNLGIEGDSTTLEDESDVAWLQHKIEARLNVLWDQLDENPGDKLWKTMRKNWKKRWKTLPPPAKSRKPTKSGKPKNFSRNSTWNAATLID